MGGGCFRAATGETQFVEGAPLLRSQSSAATTATDLRAELAPVLQAANSASPKASKLDEVLAALRNAAPPKEVGAWFRDWFAKASTKSRLELFTLLKRAAAHALQSKIDAVAVALSTCGEAASDFERVCGLAEDGLRLDSGIRDSLSALAEVADQAACTCVRLPKSKDSAADYVIPAFDQIVLLFRRAIFADIASGSLAGRLQRWREVFSEVGLPTIEKYLILLSCMAKSIVMSLLLVPEEAPAAQIVISRDACVLLSSASQLPDASACILSPYFESSTGTKMIQGKRVEGGEGHGPRKEFFIAMSDDSRKAAGGGRPPPLFTFFRGSGQYWFSAYASDFDGASGKDQRARFHCFGKALALAVVNHCRLSFSLPKLFFAQLLHPTDEELPRPSLEHIASLDGALHVSLKKCVKMRNADFKALKDASGLPPEMSREDYIAHQVSSFMCIEAMHEVRCGFWRLAGEASCWRGVAPNDLRQMLCPSYSAGDEINVRQIFEVVEEELAECQPFVSALWAVIDGLAAADKRLFLLFVTGVEAPPEPGTEQLTIQLPFSAFSKEEHSAMLEKLPQAHTCSNTLELPSYHEALLETGVVAEDQGPEFLESALRRVVGEKLLIAIRETSGYELDAVDCEDEDHGTLDVAETRPVHGISPSPRRPQAVTDLPVADEQQPPAVDEHEADRDSVPGGAVQPSPELASDQTFLPQPPPAVEASPPMKQDFQSFLESLAHPGDAAPAAGVGQKCANIDNLLDELSQAMYDER